MRRSLRRRAHLLPEVGLTPLIDTTLTLLIVFMVTTPAAIEHAIKLDLPRGALQEGGKQPQEYVVSIDKKGAIFFNNRPIKLDRLGAAVQELVAHDTKKQEKSLWVRVQGDTTTVSTLTAVLDQVKLVGGIKDVKIATQKDTPAVV
ncbi:MAG: biopolymer transporter ExbD [Candidatus Babeliales bacterium]